MSRLCLAWIVALLGTLLSIYFSEVEGFDPCHLCWYQRIALFPLAIILGIAVYRGDRLVSVYALPLVFLGFVIAAYQWISTLFPALRMDAMCGVESSCSDPVFTFFGFLTFPALSALGFFAIGALLLCKKTISE